MTSEELKEKVMVEVRYGCYRKLGHRTGLADATAKEIEQCLSWIFAPSSAAEGEQEKPPFTAKVLYIGDFTDDKVRMGQMKFNVKHAALVVFPTAGDCAAMAKNLLQDVVFTPAVSPTNPTAAGPQER